MTATTSAKLRTSSTNVRAFLRNLWINAFVGAAIIGIYYFTDFFKITTMTSTIDTAVYWAIVGGIIAWVVFLFHWFGELVLQLRKGNYHYLWSMIPFFIPLICFLAHATMVSWLPWPFD